MHLQAEERWGTKSTMISVHFTYNAYIMGATQAFKWPAIQHDKMMCVCHVLHWEQHKPHAARTPLQRYIIKLALGGGRVETPDTREPHVQGQERTIISRPGKKELLVLNDLHTFNGVPLRHLAKGNCLLNDMGTELFNAAYQRVAVIPWEHAHHPTERPAEM